MKGSSVLVALLASRAAHGAALLAADDAGMPAREAAHQVWAREPSEHEQTSSSADPSTASTGPVTNVVAKSEPQLSQAASTRAGQIVPRHHGKKKAKAAKADKAAKGAAKAAGLNDAQARDVPEANAVRASVPSLSPAEASADGE